MSLKVIDGAKAIDGANLACDIDYQTLTVGGTANVESTSVDMSEFFELLAHITVDAVDAGCTLKVAVQESDEADASFTNITGALAEFAAGAADDSVWMSVNWKHPDRKRYARLQAIVTGANTALLTAGTLRVQPHGGPMSVDTGVVEVK